MSKDKPASKSIHSLLPWDIEGFNALAKLALDLLTEHHTVYGRLRG